MITAPTQISNCQVWLDASDRTSLFQLSGGAAALNNDPVGLWQNKVSPLTGHFVSSGTARPTYNSALSCLVFDGSNDTMSAGVTMDYFPKTFFMVLAVNSPVSQSTIIGQWNSSSGVSPVIHGHYTGTVNNSYASNIHSPSRQCNVGYRPYNIFDVFTHKNNGGNIQNFINGVGSSIVADSIAATPVYTGMRLGVLGAAGTGNPSSGSGGFFNGSIAEVIIYNKALSNAEQEDVTYYLTRKWNALNVIPRQVYATKSSLWSDSTTWSTSADPVPWNFPLSADNVYSNTFTITADSSTRVSSIRNIAVSPNITAGGSFVLANGVSLSANMAATVTPLISSFVSTNSEIIGINATTNSSVTHIIHTGTGNLLLRGSSFSFGATNNSPFLRNAGTGNCRIVGNISGGTNNANSSQIANVSSGRIEVVGNVQSVYFYPVILNSGTGSIYLTGSAVGSTNPSGYGISNTGGGYVFVDGTVGSYSATSSNNAGVNNSNGRAEISGIVAPAGLNVTGSASTSITGNVISTNAYGSAFSTSTTPLSVYGNIINAPNGRQAIYAPRYQVFPIASATYTRQAVNGYDSYTNYWTSNATFTYPASSDVVLGTVYSNNTLSGSMALPPASAVALGAFVGTTLGTASITLEGLLKQPAATLNTPNSIGARLKNVATTQALSAIANTLDFNN
jgi:hypothetical protein